MKIKISDIKIKKRLRKDAGDLSELVNSIHKNGLFNPVLINEKNELLAGYRRIQAVKLLGWSEVECNTINAKSRLDKFNIEVDENTARKDFSYEELLYIEEMKKYLNAKGLKKVFLWIKMMIKNLFSFIKGLFSKKKY